jgi:epoxyqueuosine reductase
MMTDNFPEWLKQTARKIGAHSAACIRMDNPQLDLGIAENNLLVADWLKAGKHGEMDYLQQMFCEKSNPRLKFAFAKSVIVLTFTNCWGDPSAVNPFPAPAPDALIGYISAYAREVDYHSTGQTLLAKLKLLLGDNIQAEATVDTKAVYERLFATIGGLGVVGGNDLIRVPDLGTRVFIGCLFVDQELPEVILDSTPPFPCESCRACTHNCPTGAIQFDQPIDGRKCISYLTIEKRSPLSHDEAVSVGDWIFGCDGCTSVCPPELSRDLRIPVDLEWLLKSPASQIRRTIKGNATAYAGVTQLRKNAVVVLKNMGTKRADELLHWVAENSGSDVVRAQIDLW